MLNARPASADTRRQRRFGAYYTPASFSRPLVRWGLRDGRGDVLDPSYGGCSFLHAALDVLQSHGATTAGGHIYGVDIAPEAAVYGGLLQARGVPSSHLIGEDFFDVEPGRPIPKVDLVVGNPPYIRHHWFQDGARDHAVAAVARQGVTLHGRSNAWAYFVVHASSFLRDDGRMAFLLPGAALFAEYAGEVLDHVARRFASCALVKVGERVFEDAREATTILLAEGYGQGGGSPTFFEVAGLAELEDLLMDGGKCRQTPDTRRPLGLPAALSAGWLSVLQHSNVLPLYRLAETRIGVVTGANHFFVVPPDEAQLLEAYGARTVPVLARARTLSSTLWCHEDQKREEARGGRTRLVVVDPTTAPAGAVEAWIRRGEANGLHLRVKCAERAPWYAIWDVRLPDAFLRSMGSSPPRLVANGCAATCTNAIHRLWWRDGVCAQDVIVGASTSIFSLACELQGQVYGGGVLKINLAIGRRLPIPVVSGAGRGLPEIERLIRAGEIAPSRALADSLVLPALGLSRCLVAAIEAEVARLQRARMILEGKR